MKRLNLRVTDLDAYRHYLNSEMTESEFIERINRKSKPNEAMLAGSAWHKIMENADSDLDGTIEQDGFKFRILCDDVISIPQVTEIRAGIVYDMNGLYVHLTGGCDGITGIKITDHKLTFNPNLERYADSMQWRSYLKIYDADVFEYIVYCAKQNQEFIDIYSVSKITFFSYPHMGNDVFEATRDLVYFIQDHAQELIEN